MLNRTLLLCIVIIDDEDSAFVDSMHKMYMLKKGQTEVLRSHFSRKHPSSLSLPQGFGIAQGSD